MEEFDRITQNPAVMGGKACIRGMRITVGTVVGLMGASRTMEEILDAYSYLEREDVLQSVRYAAMMVQGREVILAAA